MSKVQQILATNTSLGVMHPDGNNLTVGKTGILDVTDKVAKSDLSNISHSDRTDLNDGDTLATSKAVNDLGTSLGSNKANISGDNAPMLVNTYEDQIVSGVKTFKGNPDNRHIRVEGPADGTNAGLIISEEGNVNNYTSLHQFLSETSYHSRLLNQKGDHAAYVDITTNTENNTSHFNMTGINSADGCPTAGGSASGSEFANASWVRARINENNANFVPKTGGTFTGKIYASYFQSTSDKNCKNNISNITNSLEILDGITGYKYNLIGDNTGKKCGVIAQDVEKVLPEAIQKNENGYLTVDYNAIVAILVNCVKEQELKINDLETRLNKLENK